MRLQALNYLPEVTTIINRVCCTKRIEDHFVSTLQHHITVANLNRKKSNKKQDCSNEKEWQNMLTLVEI